MQPILIIEDDQPLCQMLSKYLEGRGFEVTAAASAGEGLAALERRVFDAVILDLMLPDLDGFEVCRRIRASSQVPIVILTARGDEEDRIVGLELGADDYLPKPFNPRELLARIRAVLRRGTASPEQRRPVLRFGRLEIDPDARQARLDGRPCALTSYQFELLRVLADNAGRPLSREELMSLARADGSPAVERSIDVHMSRIRASIEDDPRDPRRILTVRGVGYVLTRAPEDGGAG